MGVYADGGLKNVIFQTFLEICFWYYYYLLVNYFLKWLFFLCVVGFLALFCVGSTDFHPKRCLGGRFWAKTKFWKILIFRPPSAWTPICAPPIHHSDYDIVEPNRWGPKRETSANDVRKKSCQNMPIARVRQPQHTNACRGPRTLRTPRGGVPELKPHTRPFIIVPFSKAGKV